MKPVLLPKEYKELLGERAQIEKELRRFLTSKLLVVRNSRALREMAYLKLKGGPKDLSAKLDNYLYA